MIILKQILLTLYFVQIFVYKTNSQRDRVLLKDVTTITLERGKYTTGRRSSPIPQLECIGGTASGKYAPRLVQCYNRGFDGRDVQWECKAQLKSDFEFGKIEVLCEGYDYPDDPYILAGSCGLRYELHYTPSGAKKHSYFSSSMFQNNGISITGIVYFVIACFIIYLLYVTLFPTGNEGDRSYRGNGFDYGSGNSRGGGGGGNSPFGWRYDAPPSYNDCNYKGGCSTSTSENSGPGFFTGLGLGALGGYLFGNNRSYNNYGSSTSYFNRGYNDYEPNTGFSGPFSSTYYDDSPSTSQSTYTSTSFGGTRRR